MKRLITLVSLVATVGCGGIMERYVDDSDAADSTDAVADTYIPDSAPDVYPDSSPDADVPEPDSDLDMIVSDGSGDADDGGDGDTPDAAPCTGGLNFLSQQGITYSIGDVTLNGDGSFNASGGAKGWYRNSTSNGEYNVVLGNYLVLSRATPAVPGMTGVTRILEYIGYDSTYNLVQFRDLGTSGVMNGVVYNDGFHDLWEINVGGNTFNGTVDTATGRISPNVDSGESYDGAEVILYTAEGDKTMEEFLCPRSDE